MVPGHSISKGFNSACIGRDHAANGSRASGTEIDTDGQIMFGNFGFQCFEDNSGFNNDSASKWIDRKNPIHTGRL